MAAKNVTHVLMNHPNRMVKIQFEAGKVYHLTGEGARLKSLSLKKINADDLEVVNQQTGDVVVVEHYFSDPTRAALVFDGEAGLQVLSPNALVDGGVLSSDELLASVSPYALTTGASVSPLWLIPLALTPAAFALGLNSDGSTSTPAPTPLAQPTLKLTEDTGNSATDNVSKNATLALSAPASDVTRTFSINGGAASSNYTAPTQDGQYTVVVTDTDRSGKSASATLIFTLDTTIDRNANIVLTTDSGGSATDGITNNAALTLPAAPESDVVRTYRVNGGEASAVYVAPTTDGVYTVVVTDTDVAGNTNTIATTFTLDTTLATPTIALTQDTGTSATDHLTRNSALTVSPAADGVTRTFKVTGELGDTDVPTLELVEQTLNSYGGTNYSETGNGKYTVTVTDVDAAGNVATASIDFTKQNYMRKWDLALTNDSGLDAHDRVTNDASIDFIPEPWNSAMSYLLEPAGISRIFRVNGGEATSTYIAPTVDGDYTVEMTETDVVGNTYTSSIDFTLDKTIDTPTIALTQDTGTSATDHLTRNSALTVSPAADGVTRTFKVTGSINAILPASIEVYEQILNSFGGTNYSETLNGEYTVTVTDVDAAGNVATASIDFIKQDHMPEWDLALTNDSGFDAHDRVTNDASIDFILGPGNMWHTGSYMLDPAGISRTFRINGGEATSTYIAPTVDGDYTVEMTETDVVGNTYTSIIDFQLDTKASRSISFFKGGFDVPDLVVYGDGASLYQLATEDGVLYSSSSTFTMPVDRGVYTLTAQGADRAGNDSVSNALRIVVGDAAADNSLIDLPSMDSLFMGGDLNDSIYANGGVDMIYAGAGNDDIYVNAENLLALTQVFLSDQDFLMASNAHFVAVPEIIDGGAGFDVLHITEAMLDFSLAGLSNQLKNIEVIQFDAGSAPTAQITVDANSVMAISSVNGVGAAGATGLDASKYQMVFGSNNNDGGAKLYVANTSDWVNSGTSDFLGHTFQVYDSVTSPVQFLI